MDARRDSGAKWSPAGLRVLLVDDDPVCLKLVQRLLTRCNYEVTPRRSGHEALRELHAGSRPFDIVLSELKMPGMDGFMLLEYLSLELAVPVVEAQPNPNTTTVMSSDGDPEVVLDSIAHGAVGFLIKPIGLKDVMNIWQHALRHRRDQLTPRHATLPRHHFSDKSPNGYGGICSGVPNGGQRELGGSWKRERRTSVDSPNMCYEQGRRLSLSDDRTRDVWTATRHQNFVKVVGQLGLEDATPDCILQGLGPDTVQDSACRRPSMHDVSDHLERYRAYMQRAADTLLVTEEEEGEEGGGAEHEMSEAGPTGSQRAMARLLQHRRSSTLSLPPPCTPPTPSCLDEAEVAAALQARSSSDPFGTLSDAGSDPMSAADESMAEEALTRMRLHDAANAEAGPQCAKIITTRQPSLPPLHRHSSGHSQRARDEAAHCSNASKASSMAHDETAHRLSWTDSPTLAEFAEERRWAAQRAMARLNSLPQTDSSEVDYAEIQLGQQIGYGSFGVVYRATWNFTDVAVKRLLEQQLGPQALADFRHEVALMKRLKHPNIVMFLGAVTTPPNLAILTQYVPRGCLFRMLHRSGTPVLPLKQRLQMAIDVARGMHYLHTQSPPIIHRDLKTPNLLVDTDYTVKVCDFGMSRVQSTTMMSNKSGAGTPEWTAPEVLKGEMINEKSDVYSYGVILWELMTLEVPWSSLSHLAVVGAVGFGNRRLKVPEGTDPVAARIIEACFGEAAQRPSFAQILGKLRPHVMQLADEHDAALTS